MLEDVARRFLDRRILLNETLKRLGAGLRLAGDGALDRHWIHRRRAGVGVLHRRLLECAGPLVDVERPRQFGVFQPRRLHLRMRRLQMLQEFVAQFGQPVSRIRPRLVDVLVQRLEDFTRLADRHRLDRRLPLDARRIGQRLAELTERRLQLGALGVGLQRLGFSGEFPGRHRRRAAIRLDGLVEARLLGPLRLQLLHVGDGRLMDLLAQSLGRRDRFGGLGGDLRPLGFGRRLSRAGVLLGGQLVDLRQLGGPLLGGQRLAGLGADVGPQFL